MTGRFKRRQGEVDAFQWHGEAPSEWPEWARSSLLLRYEITNIQVDTPNGTVRANPGDWILRRTEDDIYPCDGEMFQSLYEPV